MALPGFNVKKVPTVQNKLIEEIVDYLNTRAYVDADAGDGALQCGARAGVFDEHAHHLAVAEIDVVGPLDAGVDAESGQAVGQCERHDLREQELLGNGQKRGLEHQREGDALGGAGPGMAALAAPGGLAFGPDDVAVAVFRASGVVVGRGGLFDAADHAAVRLVRRSRAGRRSARFSCRSIPCGGR